MVLGWCQPWAARQFNTMLKFSIHIFWARWSHSDNASRQLHVDIPDKCWENFSEWNEGSVPLTAIIDRWGAVWDSQSKSLQWWGSAPIYTALSTSKSSGKSSGVMQRAVIRDDLILLLRVDSVMERLREAKDIWSTCVAGLHGCIWFAGIRAQLNCSNPELEGMI